MHGRLPYTLAVIPARGGSKGVPRKNLALLGGLPLVAWSIRAALSCPGIHRVVVSTDDEEIAQVSREHGGEVPFLRPAELAGDSACLGDALQHAVEQLDGPTPQVVITLLPTHPFRTRELMHLLTAKAQAGYGRVRTVVPIRVHSASHFVMNEQGRLSSIFANSFPDQAIDEVVLYRYHGLFDSYAPAIARNRIYNHVLHDSVHCIDIDDHDDLQLARHAVEHGLFTLENL